MLLMLRPVGDKDFADKFLVAADQLALFERVYFQHYGQHPRSWASLTTFPWIEYLELMDVEAFLQDQTDSLLDAARHRSLIAYYGNLRGWESYSKRHQETEVWQAF